MNEVLSIAGRSAAVYLCIVLLIRVFGKKELSQLSVTDLVFILLISNSVQNAMVGASSTLVGGLVAAATLFALNSLFRILIFKFKPVEKFLEGEALILVFHGKANHPNLEKVKITMEELNATIREHGIENIRNVDLAILEVDGNISVLSNDYKHVSVKERKHHKISKQTI